MEVLTLEVLLTRCPKEIKKELRGDVDDREKRDRKGMGRNGKESI